MPIPVSGFAHLRVTVSDIVRSRTFYDEFFGFPVALELPPDADAETRERLWFLFGGVVYRLPHGSFALRPVGPEGDVFDENRVGLDHVSFEVPTRGDLDTAAAKLDAMGVAHNGIKEIGNGWILEFRDPDGIALELFSAA